MNALKFIYQAQKEITELSGIYALLDWDEKTNMPPKGIDDRAEQEALIYKLIFERMTSDEMCKALSKLKKQRLSRKQKIILKELDKQVKKLMRVPKKLAVQIAKEAVLASSKWQEARKQNNLQIFLPSLKKLVALKRKQARLINPKLTPYDALLDDFEEGMRSEKLDKIFGKLKKELIQLLEKIKKTKEYKSQKEMRLATKQKDKEALAEDIIKKMMLTKESSRLDVSAHPFTLRISKSDVRITTRYTTVFDGFFSAIHEGGHALYELGMPKEYKNTVIYDAPSTGLHESQSRMWENQIARSKNFWKGYAKSFSRITKKKLSWKDLYTAVNIIKPSFIRVDADEITYCLHVILRYEIEKNLINGKLKAEDADKEWNKKMKELLGITPKNDNQGMLQDVHWSCGLFGYFPTYALGTIYARQICSQAEKEIKSFSELVKKQDFAKIIGWLRKKIHTKGKTMTAEETVKKICGKGLDAEEFTDYLAKKYSEIYAK
jgi:carboxypeptidase Taq